MLTKINDIKAAIENKAYLSGLALALTLPDTCGKVAYPKLYSKERYIKWFSEHASDYFPTPPAKLVITREPVISFDAEICYQLRCHLLHEGSIDITSNTKLTRFELCITDDEYHGTHISKYRRIWKNGKKDHIHSQRIEVIGLCKNLCDAAKAYYNQIPNKSLFENQKIVIMNLHDFKNP